jgi:hypothetical protein
MIAYAVLACDPALARLFTPPHPQLGIYEVCTTPTPIDRVKAEPNGVAYGPTETMEALDAFGGAGTYDPSALARLYGGRRAAVARGWRADAGQTESITLISPYPNASLTGLEPGTLIIRWTLNRGL